MIPAMSPSRSRVFFLLSLLLGVVLGVFVSVGLQRALSPGGATSASAAPAEPRAAALRPDLDDDEAKTIALFQRASVSVAFVTTRVQRMDFWTRNVFEVPQGTGSAFLWDDRGHVVTNYHVVQDAASAQVTLGDQEYEASLVGAAPEHDLAVLRIRQGSEKFVPLKIGTSRDLQVGQKVYRDRQPLRPRPHPHHRDRQRPRADDPEPPKARPSTMRSRRTPPSTPGTREARSSTARGGSSA